MREAAAAFVLLTTSAVRLAADVTRDVTYAAEPASAALRRSRRFTRERAGTSHPRHHEATKPRQRDGWSSSCFRVFAFSCGVLYASERFDQRDQRALVGVAQARLARFERRELARAEVVALVEHQVLALADREHVVHQAAERRT